jgi:hypothetical protein
VLIVKHITIVVQVSNFSGFNGVCAFSGRRRSRRQRDSQDLTAFVLSVVGDVPVDSEAPPVTARLSGFNGVCAFSGRRRSRRQRGLRACIHREECACVVSVSDVLCN